MAGLPRPPSRAARRAVHWSLAQRLYNLAHWWHLLSLDAPTVAALWSWFFARAMHLRLPMFASALLALGTWLLYVGDRILDGLRPGERLRARHHFHARHRNAFLFAAAVFVMPLLWFGVARMSTEALREDTFLGGFAVLYFFFVHRKRSGRCVYLPKELAVALLFAAASAVPAWSRLGLGREQLAPAVLSFALLCWVNCVGIEKWEGGAATHAHVLTRWAMLHLRLIVTVIAFCMLVAAWRAPSRGLLAVYLAAMLSSAFLFVLDTRSGRLSPLHVRIAADAALLTPLAFVSFSR